MKRLLIAALALAGILSSGCIVHHWTLTNPDDTAHWVGLASNLTNVDVVAASVQVDFLDSSGRVIHTENVSPCTRTLQKHNSSPVEASLPSGTEADDVRVTLHPLSFGTKAVADLDVDDDDIVITTDGDDMHIEGTVEVGDDDLSDINVCVALYDDDGNVLGVGSDNTSPEDIDEDGSGTFDVSIDTSIMEDPDDIDQFELWVDASVGKPDYVTAPVVVGREDVEDYEATPTPTVTGTPPTATATATPTETATPTTEPTTEAGGG